jgi:two-component system NarL family sensor kinase
MQTISQITVFVIITTAIIFLLASLIVSLLYVYQKRQLLYQQNLNNLKLDFEKNLLKTQVEIQEQTFQHISRDIHDNINLSLTLAKLNLNTLDWFEIENVYTSVKSTINIIGATIEGLSNLSKGMNPELIRNLGLLKAVKNEVNKLIEMAHLDVTYEVSGEPIFMESEKELVIFRIIQEAFNNIIKHAGASKVWLYLNYNESCLEVLIKDDGVGFEKEEVFNEKDSQKAGLNNMQTRARLFGGTVMIESNQNKGTQILVKVPY